MKRIALVAILLSLLSLFIGSASCTHAQQDTTDDTTVSTSTGDQPQPNSDDCDNPPPEATMCTDGGK